MTRRSPSQREFDSRPLLRQPPPGRPPLWLLALVIAIGAGVSQLLDWLM